jgi:hypothetical protein
VPDGGLSQSSRPSLGLHTDGPPQELGAAGRTVTYVVRIRLSGGATRVREYASRQSALQEYHYGRGESVHRLPAEVDAR